MIYLIFALIATAFVFYLNFADKAQLTASRRRAHTPEDLKQGELREKIAIIKSSLKDLSYEASIGKIDQENFQFLQNDLLRQWDELNLALEAADKSDAKSQPVDNDTCGQCGAAIVAGVQARFCHACGSPL